MPPDEAGREALAHIDDTLAKRPEKDGHILSAAIRCLAEFRDRLIEARRRAGPEADDGALDLVNAVISSVMAAQYPLGEMPWDELARSRGWLKEALARAER